MDDKRIVELYWDRDESAIQETSDKYESYLHSIAMNVLAVHEDAEESVNDTYNDAWNSMPPHRPSILATFLGKITRRLSIDKWRARTAAKRGAGQTATVLDELEHCVSGSDDVAKAAEANELTRFINAFLADLPETERSVFLCRYWYMDPIESIAKQFGFSQSKVTSMLFRTRNKLRSLLEKEELL